MSKFADLLDVLYEDNHLLALNKPAGWPTTHFDGQDETVDRLAKSYIKEKYNKPGNVFIGVVHRLDKLTSGCLLFARTSKAASRLSEQFRENAVEKKYWAVIPDQPIPQQTSLTTITTTTATKSKHKWTVNESGSFDDFLLHDDDEKIVRIVDKQTENAKPARLLYTVKAITQGMVLLEIQPHTGRKHQIRVQFASRGYPILGDNKYGSPLRFANFIGLHARQLTFLHPTTGNPITLTAEPPKYWQGRFAYLLANS